MAKTEHTGGKMVSCTFGEYEIYPEVGSEVIGDAWSMWQELLLENNWDKAEFRIMLGIADVHPEGIAARVTVTGRATRRFKGRIVIRVKITFPGDGEPDTHTGGWMVAN